MAFHMLTLQFALFGVLMFCLGSLASTFVCSMLFRRTIRRASGEPDENGVTRDDIRAELMLDAFATELMCSDDTPEDVARYLYLEAERRARLRKQGVSVENENDLFSKPHSNPEPLQ